MTTFKTAKQWNFLSSNPSTILEKENIPDIQLALLNFTQNRFQKGQLCHNDFCCQYDIEVFVHRLPPNSVSYFPWHFFVSFILYLQKQLDTNIIFKSTILQTFYSYAIVAFDGFISYLPHSSTIIHSTVCGMVACATEKDCDFK